MVGGKLVQEEKGVPVADFLDVKANAVVCPYVAHPAPPSGFGALSGVELIGVRRRRPG